MPANNPTILALDFDGVLCDGLIEYFQTAWRTYCQVWKPANQTPPDDLAESFYQLRPVIEIGWEMPILIRALILNLSKEEIWQDWIAVAKQILIEDQLNSAELGVMLDQLRDEWLTTDLEGWLGLHRFYPGVVEKVKSLLATSVQPIIITTKEGRFVDQLLRQQGIQLDNQWIIGKESQRPKHQVLRELLSELSAGIWFVEDRLKTLQSVQQQPDLKAVQLYLADWGYNTLQARESVLQDPRIKLLSLSQFTEDFSTWP